MRFKSCMSLSACISGMILVGALVTPSNVEAAVYTEVMNAGACTPYPASQATAMAYQHYLYGWSNSAFCHLRIPSPWSVQYLRYVFFEAQAGGSAPGPLTARLCVHSGSLSVTCGPATTVMPGTTFQWVSPPTSLPTYVLGAYVHFSFPASPFWIVRYLLPYWYN